MPARRLRNAESGRKMDAVRRCRATAPTRPRAAHTLTTVVLCGEPCLCFTAEHRSESTATLTRGAGNVERHPGPRGVAFHFPLRRVGLGSIFHIRIK